MAKTSVILPCWIIDNIQLKLTERCIGSIRETSDVELIIVDNGSLIGFDFLRDEADIYVRFPINRGYARAINTGFMLSTKTYIVAGNNDYFLSDGWEDAQIEVLESVKDAGIACLHVDGDYKPDTLLS